VVLRNLADSPRDVQDGAGNLATAAHGRPWFEAAIAEKVDHIAEIHEQQRRREARRTAGFGLWGAS